MKRLRLLFLAAAVLVAALLAIPALSAGAATRTVGVRDRHGLNDRFTPRRLTVHRGTKIRWVWKGTAFHNVFVRRGPAKFHSKLQKKGTFRHRMTRAGTYKIICQVHPGMTMTLKVT
jgi:plastocyanin